MISSQEFQKTKAPSQSSRMRFFVNYQKLRATYWIMFLSSTHWILLKLNQIA